VPSDTTPEAYRAQIEAYRRMGGKGRSEVAFRLSDLVRRTAMAGIRERHPEYGEQEVQRAFVHLLLGAELVKRIWPRRRLVAP